MALKNFASFKTAGRVFGMPTDRVQLHYLLPYIARRNIGTDVDALYEATGMPRAQITRAINLGTQLGFIRNNALVTNWKTALWRVVGKATAPVASRVIRGSFGNRRSAA
jgi:hypothetical protein